MTPDLALGLEVALYADEFRHDFHRLLALTGATVELGWFKVRQGRHDRDRAYLVLRFDGGPREPFVEYRPELNASVWTLHTPRTIDFRERFERLLAHHKAEFGVGISFAKRIARFNVGFPRAPRMKATDIPLSLRLVYTRRGQYGEYVPEPGA